MRRALDKKETLVRKNHPVILSVINNLALELANHDKNKTAEEMLRRVLKEREKALVDDHLDALLSVAKLDLVFPKKNKYETTEVLYRRALEELDNVLGKIIRIHCEFSKISVSCFGSAHTPNGQRDFIADIKRKGAGTVEASLVHAEFRSKFSYPLGCMKQIQ